MCMVTPDKGSCFRIAASIVGVLAIAQSVYAQSAERRWLSEPILSATYVDRDGTLFGDAQEIVRLPFPGFAVVDRGANTVRAFFSDGSPAWDFGRSGEGPGEFSFIQDIDLTPRAEILILDRNLNRVTMIEGTTGELLTSFQLQTKDSYGILPSGVSPNVLVVPATSRDGELWNLVSEDGRVLETARMPLPCAHNLACEFFTTVTGNEGSAIAFRWSSKLIFLDPDGSVRLVTDGIEQIPFPEVKRYEVPSLSARVTRVDPMADEAVAKLAADDIRLFVLSLGTTEYRARTVDTYSVVTGEYLGSFLFPDDLEGIAILSDGRLATLDTDFFPTVQLWELK